MLKVSSSLYKIPYFNVETKSLKSINRRKDDYQEIICMCRTGCTTDQEGFKYSFKGPDIDKKSVNDFMDKASDTAESIKEDFKNGMK